MFAVDTNIIVYAEGVGSDDRPVRAKRLLRALPRERTVIPAQVLGEAFRVLRAKGRLSAQTARERLAQWEMTATIAPTSATTISAALDLAARHDLQIFDSIILSAAAEAGCSLLLSEDFGDGFIWRGVMVVNPFAAQPHPTLAAAIQS